MLWNNGSIQHTGILEPLVRRTVVFWGYKLLTDDLSVSVPDWFAQDGPCVVPADSIRLKWWTTDTRSASESDAA